MTAPEQLDDLKVRTSGASGRRLSVRLRPRRRVRRRVQGGDRIDRARGHGSSTSPTSSRRTTSRAGALTLVRSVQYLPEGALVLAVVDPGRRHRATARRRGVRAGDLLRPRQRAPRPGGRDARRCPRRCIELTDRASTGSPPGPDLRRPRRARAGAWRTTPSGVPARRARAARSTRPGSSRAWSACRARSTAARRGRGVVGRPVRELPAQPRARRARGAGRRAPAGGSRSGSATRPGRPAGSAPTPTPSRRSSCCSSTATGLLRARARPPLGRRRVGTAEPARRSHWYPPAEHEPTRSEVRQGTTIAIVALLVLIFAAALAQFVLRLGRIDIALDPRGRTGAAVPTPGQHPTAARLRGRLRPGLGAGWEAGDPTSPSARRLTLPTPTVPEPRLEVAERPRRHPPDCRPAPSLPTSSACVPNALSEIQGHAEW